MRPRVLVVGRDAQQAERLTQVLALRGYDASAAASADTALSGLQRLHPALIITDLEMPEVDGLELCRRVRQHVNTPIIVVSDDADVWTEVTALETGADDFLVRPVNTETLLARIRVILRRGGSEADTAVMGVGPFNIDFNARRIHVNGQTVRLTPKEFDLFTFMARHPNRVLTRRTLLTAVWGVSCEEQSEYLRVFVGQLRKKLEDDPSRPRYLVTEPWVGYRFNPSGLVQH